LIILYYNKVEKLQFVVSDKQNKYHVFMIQQK